MDTLIFPNQTRNRAWRRWQSRKNSHRQHVQKQVYCWKPEKNWKLLYTRGVKAHRARQLGFIYPLSKNDFYAEWFD
ncbi:hypothetical protein [Wielerella bovis]|uniref:hypothetical protein n=1 Tax=Wielerella bovis TaxID=2917790 RepID=UPI00201902FC|nr:hypothetical protein [Wielerella bovis]ULJ65423.1 hypothetical protein MIS33_03910 [Wielerella bovis]ULJ67768.1 hypothetical protein MIS31_04275 [Wielerella bovis]